MAIMHLYGICVPIHQELNFPAYANQVTNDIVTYAEEFTASLKRSLVYLTSAKIPKEQTALAVLEESPLEKVLICTLSEPVSKVKH